MAGKAPKTFLRQYQSKRTRKRIYRTLEVFAHSRCCNSLSWRKPQRFWWYSQRFIRCPTIFQPQVKVGLEVQKGFGYIKTVSPQMSNWHNAKISEKAGKMALVVSLKYLLKTRQTSYKGEHGEHGEHQNPMHLPTTIYITLVKTTQKTAHNPKWLFLASCPRILNTSKKTPPLTKWQKAKVIIVFIMFWDCAKGIKLLTKMPCTIAHILLIMIFYYLVLTSLRLKRGARLRV